MKTVEEKAQYLLAQFKENTYIFWAGAAFNIDDLPFYAYSDKESILLYLNLAHGNKPHNKAYYTDLLYQLLQLYQEMLVASPDFQHFTQEKIFIAQLCVYSGQMDFTICELKNEQIEWLSNIE